MVEVRASIELHGFGNASPTAYGAAVYIKCLGEAGHASNHLVMSKSRVAPASAGSKELSAEELQDAKLSWYRQIQQELYQAEYERLKEDPPFQTPVLY